MLKLHALLFGCIIVLGFMLRTINLTQLPAGFHADEASIGYNAYSILQSGTDEYGTPFPVFFKAFGEYKSPVQIYSSVPIIYLFGLNVFSIRFTSVLYGVLGLIAIYLLVKELFQSDKQRDNLALLSMLFLAVSPWHIHFSRVGYEMMPFIFFTTLGLYLFLRSQRFIYYLPAAILAFALALYSYFPARLFIPLLGIGLLILYHRFFLEHKRWSSICLFFLIILLIPFLQNLLSPIGLARWEQVNVFTHPPTNETVISQIGENYFRHFSVDFLFLQGDIGMPGRQVTRDSVRGMGELYFFQLPLILAGIYMLIKRKNKHLFLLGLWLLLYPVGSMFSSYPYPLARRSIIGVVPFQILSAVGLVYLREKAFMLKRWLSIPIITVSLLVVFFSCFSYGYEYFFQYNSYSSDFWGWQYGPKDIVAYFTAHETEYNDLILSPYFNAPGEFFKFYSPHGCQKCKYGLPENYYIPNHRQLYALPPYYIQSHLQYTYLPVKTIYYPNGSIAFVLTKIVGKK